MNNDRSQSQSLSVSLSITTHNRVDDLAHTLRELRRLQPAPLEIIVCADGCSDGTEAYVREHYPQVRLFSNHPGRGSVASRDRIIREARGDLVLSLDDDSYPVEDHFLAVVAELFAAHGDIGVMTFPQRSDEFPETLHQSNFGASMEVATYTSSGAVIRKAFYMRLRGFPGIFFHAYEEPDFALQCLAAGWRTVLFTGLTVRHHYSSAQRDEVRTHQRHARNECWSVLMRCPLWAIPGMALFRTARQAAYAKSRGWHWLRREPQWWLSASSGARQAWKHRSPVPWRAYWRWCRLMRNPVPISLAVESAPPHLDSAAE